MRHRAMQDRHTRTIAPNHERRTMSKAPRVGGRDKWQSPRGSRLLASGAPIKGPSWSKADRAAVELRTEYEPLGFTPEMAELARVGRALGDATRVRIMAQLAEEPR